MPAPDLHRLAEAVVLYDADHDPCRVIVAGSGVGVSHGIREWDVRGALDALRVAVRVRVGMWLGLDPAKASEISDRLIQHRDDGAGRYSILVCGAELVGQEEPAAAESRARSMRAVLVAELQRALDDQIPVTVRRPMARLEAR